MTANNASCYSTGDILGAVLGTFFSTVFVVAALGGAILYVVFRPYLQQQQEYRLRKLNENSANGGFQKPEIHSIDELTSANRTRRTRTRTGSSFSIRNNLWNTSYSDDLSQLKDYRQMRRNSWMAFFNRRRFSLDARTQKTSSFTLRTTRPSSAPRHSKASIQSSLYGEQLFDVFEVPLLSHDPVGLGFNVFGNLMEGVYVTELLNRGPARDSGLIIPGDRIVSLTVNMEHMVLEDALTILSYSSSYPIRLRIMRETKSRHGRHLGTETDDNNGDNNNSDNNGNRDNPSGATATTDGLELLHQLLFRSQSMEELSMYHPKDTGDLHDASIPSKGSWSTGLDARRKRRPVLVDDYLWSGSRVWRSEDDWFWGGEGGAATLTKNLSNPRLLGCFGEKRPSAIFSGCDSSQGSISSVQKQRKSANYLDLSKIPESSNYLVRFPAAASRSGCRSLTRMVGINLGLGCLKSRSLQTVVAAETTQGRGGLQETKRDKPERNSGGLLVEGKSVSDGDSLHEAGRRGVWAPLPGIGAEILDHRSSTARPFVISCSDLIPADVQGAVLKSDVVDVNTSEKTKDDPETALKELKSPANCDFSYSLTERRNSLSAENHQRKDNVEYF